MKVCVEVYSAMIRAGYADTLLEKKKRKKKKLVCLPFPELFSPPPAEQSLNASNGFFSLVSFILQLMPGSDSILPYSV